MKTSLALMRQTFFPRTPSGIRVTTQVLFFLIAITLLWQTLRTVSLAEVLDLFYGLRGWHLLLLAMINGLVLLTFSGRWWLFLTALGHRLPYLRLVRYRLAAFGLSYFTPGPHFGGEPLQVYLSTRRHAVSQADAIGAVALDKVLEMLFNFAFLVGGLAVVVRQHFLAAQVGASSIGYAFFLLAIPAGLLLLLWRGKHPISGSLRIVGRILSCVQRRPLAVHASDSAVTKLYTTIRHSEVQIAWLCQARPKVLLLAILASIINWIGLAGEFWLSTYVLGFGLSMTQALTALVAMRVAILLPMPAGLGVLEASQVLAMTSLGLSAADGISLSLLIRGRDVFLGVVGLWLAGVDIQVEK